MKRFLTTQAPYMLGSTFTIDERSPSPPTENPPPFPERKRPPLRALHVINGEHYAGAERVQDLLAQQLPEMGVEVGFACLKPGKFSSLRHARQATLVEMPMRFRIDLRPAIRLAGLVRKHEYDLLHTHSARALLIARATAALCGIPIVHHVHGHTASEIAGRRFTRLNAWSERLSLASTHAVIAVSTSVRNYLLEAGVEADKLFVVANGVPTRAALRPMRHSSPCVIGFVALLRRRKGLEECLQAAALLKSRGQNVRLRIVGSFETAEYENEVRREAARLSLDDVIDWRGFQKRVDLELDQMDLLAFPSVLPEGLPMVVLEAMAAGIPIVASRVSGITDVLRDGQDGLLVPPADPAALATAMEQITNDSTLAERLRRAAFDRQRQCFSDHSMATAVARIYHEVLAPQEVTP